ncbi:hypothetical protein [Saccharibacillus deserti]|uniref:hypothetical protein n=1 Tax=Saccharibacillus deserti TaxID=1634444 RepID=UPI001555279B|nr:hypothetical protein [Saccharibacillus deserti]
MPRIRRLPELNRHEISKIPTELLIVPTPESEKEAARKEVSDYLQQKQEQMRPTAVAEMKRESAAFYEQITGQKVRSN